MTIQEQLPYSQVSDEKLAFYKAIGVDYLTIYPPPEVDDDGKQLEYMMDMVKLADSHGLVLSNLAMKGHDEITMATPERERKIEWWCQTLRNMGKAGIPMLGYNFKPIGNFRTPSETGRGGVKYSTFNYAEYEREAPHHPDKVIDGDTLFANLAYFHQRIVPVAEEAGVRLALHPDDPPLPEPMGGAMRIVSTLDQYQRIFDQTPSESNAMLFCQGCVAEMGEVVPDAIRRVGRQNKIVYVHFRNIRGTPKNFVETFVDEGDQDMAEAMRTYKEVGFEGPFMMDHTPGFPDNEVGWYAGRAFAVGYIRAMIQAVYR